MPAKRAARAAASRKSEETRFVPMKRTEPSKHATDQKAGFKYANAVSTDNREQELHTTLAVLRGLGQQPLQIEEPAL